MSGRPVPDAETRRLAETTFDRNVVVVAGAGTGKTTLLANRLVHLLMREPDPLRITDVVALTFTNKAATEMKGRVRERLRVLRDGADDGTDSGAVRLDELRAHYSLSSEEVSRRANAALGDLEKAQIGTLHSFAAHLLRLYPIESRVDPEFREDDGLRFLELFAARWAEWLDAELGPKGTEHARWRRVLTSLGLEAMRELAFALRSELILVDDLLRQVRDSSLSPPLQSWIQSKRTRAAALLATYDRPKRRKAESCLAAAMTLCDLLLERGLRGLEAVDVPVREMLGKDLGDPLKDWTEADFADCSGLVRMAKGLLRVNVAVIEDAVTLLAPFVRDLHAGFLDQGWISFDGLLAKARSLLRDHPRVRERLKQEYRAILVDEFQDTDPSQYEIMLYLAERPGRCEADWRGLDLAPGKLFVVGDPKQSIYAFRRADMEAFDGVVRKLCLSGVEYQLTTNFRSHQAILDVVNACFDRLFQRQDNVQPANVTLSARPDRLAGVPSPGVAVHLVRAEADADEFDAAAANRVEAESLAAWLADEVIGKDMLADGRGGARPLQPGDVALLFRKLTQAQVYLDALRRHGLPYVTDGEKHFYRLQEVVDLVNLLRVIDNPHDEIALMGVLRSAVGGVTDRELYELRELDAFDYRAEHRLAAWNSPRAGPVRRLYACLAGVSREAPARALPEVIDLLFDRLPVLELATASLHGEQAAANLLKVRQMAAELADRPHLTLTGFVDLMIARLSEQPDETESALAEESTAAVRVLTIHKAKGLEFPVVILPGLHHGANENDTRLISYDWSTGLFGMAIGDCTTIGAVLTTEKARLREAAERRRLLYVGMTRARERLILSGGMAARPSRGSFLELLAEAAGSELGVPGQETIRIGDVAIPQAIAVAADRSPRRRRDSSGPLEAAPDRSDLVQRWEARDAFWAHAKTSPLSVTPSRLSQRERGDSARTEHHSPAGAERARALGTLTHGLLQYWDFTADPKQFIDRILKMHKDNEIGDELHDILHAFSASSIYAELQHAEILGREVPFAIPSPRTANLDPGACILEGVLDIVYRCHGRVWIGDYKTDRVKAAEVEKRAGEYALQARLYREAVKRCMNLEAGFKFIFLRTGQVVEFTEGGW